MSISNSTLTNVLILSNITNPYSTKTTSNSVTISLSDSNNYASLYSSIATITNTQASVLASPTVSTNIGFMGSITLLSFLANLTGKQNYIVITIPPQFPQLSSSPSSLVSLIGNSSIDFVTNSSTLSLSLNLTTPSQLISDPFIIKTYTSDGYII
jgi:hypothetical protein